MRLYTRDTPTWIHMSWEARVTWPLLMRKLEREGKYDLGPWGIQGLANDLRIPLEIADAGVTGLVTAGVLVRRDGVLFAPNFYDAQNVRRALSDAERQANLRERRKIAQMATGQPTLPGVEGTPHADKRHDVTDRVTLVPSAVPLPVPSSAVPGGVGGSAPPTAPDRRNGSASHESKPSRRRGPKGTRLTIDWQPDEKTIADLRAVLRVDPLAALPAFRDFWTSKPGRRAEKLDWNATFRNWVRRDREKLPPLFERKKVEPKEPSEPPLSKAEAAERSRAIAQQLEELGE